MGFNFGEPIRLVSLLIVPVLVYFYIRYRREKRRAILKFSSVGIIKTANKRKLHIRENLPFILLLISIILIILGLSDPRIPLKTVKEGVNVVLVIDDSGSMAATDYKPSRLEAAKKSAEILIRSLKPKDNVGIVIFESGATTVSYLTPFKERAIEKLRAIQQREGKTAIGDGLSLAIDMATSIPNKKKVVILLSDGVNNAGVVTPEEAIEFARLNNIQVFTVGMGSERPVVLGYDIFGNPQYAELDEELLRRIAEETGGKYYKSVNENTLDEIYRNIGENIKRELEDTSIKDWFFASALFVLLVNIYVIYGRYRIII